MKESIVFIIAMLFRITWVLVSLAICIFIATPLAYVCMGILFFYCVCSVNYCESVIETPMGNTKTQIWQIASNVFSWANTAGIVLLLAHTLGFANV